MHRLITILLATLAILAAAGNGRAQQAPDPEGLAALRACLAANEAGQTAEAAAQADRAQHAFEAQIEAAPGDPEPRVMLARTFSQCRIPQVGMMEQGAFLGRSIALLQQALEIDPQHWGARFTLAMNHYYTPEFLGRTPEAIREFETLLAQQGDRTDFPEMAAPYAYLGDLYLRVGRKDDAVALWKRGAALFPQDPDLTRRLASESPAANPAAGAAGANDTTGEASASPSAQEVVTLDAIVVNAEGGFGMDDTRPQASLRRVDVYTAPGGTADILQVFQMLPGMTRVSEGADLYVRGGDPAESPVLIEGARLLYSGVFESPSGSVFGLLDPSVLKKAWFSSGGFSARYGDALSGIVRLETEGRPLIPTWRAGWNLAGGGATVRRALGDHSGGWASVRVSEMSLLLALHGEDEYESPPRAIEGVAGWVHEPLPGVELKAIALSQADGFTRDLEAIGWDGPFQGGGRTNLALVSARAITPDGANMIQATASHTSRGSSFAFGVLDRDRTDRAAALRVEGDHAPSSTTTMRFGAEARRLSFDETGRIPTTERVAPGSPSRPLDDGRASWHAGAWLEGELRPVPSLAFIAGARLDRLPGESGATVDPRLAVAWRRGAWTWRAGGGTFQQGRWRVGYELPDRGATAGIPRRARHLAAGLEREGDLTLKLEGYVKRYDRYVAEDDGLPTREGTIRGFDALARWTGSERWDGWVSYSLLRGRGRLDDGREIPLEHDVTHSLTAVGRRNWGPWQVGLTGRYATGRPYTPILGTEPGSDEGGFPAPLFGEPNGTRLPDYFRLDGRVTRFFPVGSGFLVAYVEMLNLTDRANTDRLIYDEQWENPRPVEGVFAERTFVAGFELQF